jgi:hypothetical protein
MGTDLGKVVPHRDDEEAPLSVLAVSRHRPRCGSGASRPPGSSRFTRPPHWYTPRR